MISIARVLVLPGTDINSNTLRLISNLLLWAADGDIKLGPIYKHYEEFKITIIILINWSKALIINIIILVLITSKVFLVCFPSLVAVIV